MPRGIYIRTEKHRLSLCVPHKIIIPHKEVMIVCLNCKKEFYVKPSWAKNRKYCSKICKNSSIQWKEIQRKNWLGRKHTEETKNKIRLKNLLIHKGEKSDNWKGGKKTYWKNEILKRDNWTCQKCGNNDRRVLNVDHIKSKAIYPKLAFDLNNGVVLCANCHAIKTYYEDTELKQWKYDKK